MSQGGCRFDRAGFFLQGPRRRITRSAVEACEVPRPMSPRNRLVGRTRHIDAATLPTTNNRSRRDKRRSVYIATSRAKSNFTNDVWTLSVGARLIHQLECRRSRIELVVRAEMCPPAPCERSDPARRGRRPLARTTLRRGVLLQRRVATVPF